jgi:hypothetical protein
MVLVGGRAHNLPRLTAGALISFMASYNNTLLGHLPYRASFLESCSDILSRPLASTLILIFHMQDFFANSVGKVNKVQLAYGPNGQSRGEATITFPRRDLAIAAAKTLNNIKVDNKPIQVACIDC